MSYVKTSVNLKKDQVDFLKSSGYSLSKLVRLQVSDLIKKSEGQTLRERPTEESGEDSNNG